MYDLRLYKSNMEPNRLERHLSEHYSRRERLGDPSHVPSHDSMAGLHWESLISFPQDVLNELLTFASDASSYLSELIEKVQRQSKERALRTTADRVLSGKFFLAQQVMEMHQTCNRHVTDTWLITNVVD